MPLSVAQQSEMGAEKFTNMIRRNVVTIIKAWITEHPEDFSEQLINKIRNFVENTVAKEDSHLAKFVRVPLAAVFTPFPPPLCLFFNFLTLFSLSRSRSFLSPSSSSFSLYPGDS